MSSPFPPGVAFWCQVADPAPSQERDKVSDPTSKERACREVFYMGFYISETYESMKGYPPWK